VQHLLNRSKRRLFPSNVVRDVRLLPRARLLLLLLRRFFFDVFHLEDVSCVPVSKVDKKKKEKKKEAKIFQSRVFKAAARVCLSLDLY
tara:strand:+ start:502 stop:765 length:264 start_codon:yes stop_codon:yes gene_type:complete